MWFPVSGTIPFPIQKAMFNQLSADQLNIGKHDPLPDDLIDFLLGIISAGLKPIRETLEHNFPNRLLGGILLQQAASLK